jgi:hypothetical protein
MESKVHIDLVLSHRIKKPPYKFRPISCSNFPKPYVTPSNETNSDNEYRYNFSQMVRVLVENHEGSSALAKGDETSELEMSLGDYLLCLLLWRLHDNGMLIANEMRLKAEIDKIQAAVNQSVSNLPNEYAYG